MTALRVALNLRNANLAIPDGHGESMRQLSRALIAGNPGHQLDLVMDAPPRYEIPASDHTAVRVLRPFPAGNRWLRRLLGADPWYRARVCTGRAWSGWSAYVQSAHEPTPLRAGPRHVTIVHDLAFMGPDADHTFDRMTRGYLDRWTAENVHRATRVLAVSNWVRDQVIEVYGIDAARVEVAPHGVDRRRFRSDHDPGAIAATRRRFELAGPYLTFVGTLQPRKNLPTLVEAYARARAGGLRHDLVLVGRPGWRYADIEPGIVDRPGVRILSDVNPDHLPLVLAGADAFVSVALAEGFGMPVLEAMASGVPVIVADAAGLAEVAGTAAERVDPHDVDAIAEALARLTGDADLRARRRAAGLERAASFTWDLPASIVWRVLEEACASS